MRIGQFAIPCLALLPLLAVAAPPVPQQVTYEPSLLVQLQVKDLDRSIHFYRDVLGFRIVERRADLQFAHVDCGIEGLQLGLSAGGPALGESGSVVLNFGVKGDIEAAKALLATRGVVFKGPTQVISGKVRLAEFQDPDGHRLRLARDETGGR